MNVGIDWGPLRGSHWQQYLLRFALGGLVTALTGLIAQHFGAVLGGLFLAFPAIFPASVTLIAKAEQDKKRRKGLHGERRGRRAAGLDATGAVLGAVGMMLFALIAWKALPRWPPVAVLGASALAWLALSLALWWLRERHWLPSPPFSRSPPRSLGA